MDVVVHFYAAGISLLLLYILNIALRAYPFIQYAMTALFVAVFAYLSEAGSAAVFSYGLLIVIVMFARTQHPWHGVFKLVALVYGLAIALKLTPGFGSIGPVASQVLSPLSGEWTIYGGVNKALVGLILLPLVRYPELKRQKLRKHYPVLLWAPVFLAGIAYLGGLEFDFKISLFTLVFLFANLTFVVIAEEIFFRGLIQQYLCEHLKGRYRVPLGIAISSVLFGVAHFAGGPVLVLFATIAGFAYGLAYWRFCSIWASIYLHLAVNVLHMVFFKFPF